MIEIELINTQLEAADVTTFKFSKRNHMWRAGQYMAVVIPGISPILQQYEHWFTISSAPFQETLDISVRQSPSPFKKALFQLKPGDKILTHTIDGAFGWPEDPAKHPIFIAGGIGITPFISMLRQQEFEQSNILATLHYFNRPHTQIPFKTEIEQLHSKHPKFEVFYHFEKPLSLSPILDSKEIPKKAIAFLAGPPPMIDRLSSELQKHNIETKLDWYFGYDVTNY